MGRDKAWLDWEGVPLIRRQLALVREAGADQVFISGRPEADYSALGTPVLRDALPDGGPMAGILAGLEAASCECLLVVAVDMPRLTPAFVRELWGRCRPGVGVVPRLDGRWEPLVAFYPRRMACLVEEHLARGRLALHDLVKEACRLGWQVPLEIGTEERPLFFNWNSPTITE